MYARVARLVEHSNASHRVKREQPEAGGRNVRKWWAVVERDPLAQGGSEVILSKPAHDAA